MITQALGFIKRLINEIKFSYDSASAPIYSPKSYSTQQQKTRNTDVQMHSFKNACFDQITIPERQEPEPIFLSSCKTFPPQTDFIAYFNNGKLFNVYPRNKSISLYEDRQTAYKARYIVSDNVKYDMEDADSIKSMVMPRFDQTHGISSPTGDLSYILKMRLGGENRPHLAVPLAYKAANLMIYSPVGWNKKDYYRLVIQLWSIGEIVYGDHLLNELKIRLPFIAAEDELEYRSKKNFNDQLSLGKYFDEDYVHIGFSGAVCPDCAPYQNRIYSLSGNDKRFPKIPDFILKNQGLHCELSIYPIAYYNGFTITQYIYKADGSVVSKEVDAIKYSNRPFVDDRSVFEKRDYEKYKEERNKRKASDERYFSRAHWIGKYYEHLEYQYIVNLLGDKAPKSYSGYSRMKKNNTTNFQKISKIALENGIQINSSEYQSS